MTRISLTRSIAIAIALPIFLHAHLLLGFLIPDPAIVFASLGTVDSSPIAGRPTIDPNLGYGDQALTSAAARLVLHGALPWWNSFEGFGTPLAGEMQCSAFFPFALLLALHGGSLALNLLMQILAGIGMILLLRRCGVAPWPAFIGGLAYENCGTFSWLSGVWSYSLPWLPFLLLGLEYLRVSGRRSMLAGTLLFAISMYFLIASGFIETSYLEGLVAIAWIVARLVAMETPRLVFLRRIAIATVLGIVLAAPLLVSFADLLAVSLLGLHNGQNSVTNHPELFKTVGLLQKILPYVYGPIFASGQVDLFDYWYVTGGYFGFSLLAVAFFALFGATLRPLRIACLAVLVLALAGIVGIPGFENLMLAIPGVRYTNYWRFLDPLVAFAGAFLTALGIDDILKSARDFRPKLSLAVGAVLTMVLIGALTAMKYLVGAPSDLDRVTGVWHVLSMTVLALVVCAFVAAMFLKTERGRALLIGITVIGELATFIVIPTLAYPPGATFSNAGITYLQEHVGLGRVYTLGPIAANYGSYYGFDLVNYNDAPVPAITATYIKKHLDPEADSFIFNGNFPRAGPSSMDEFRSRVGAYGRAGIKYVVTTPGTLAASPAFRSVYEDAMMHIDELREVTPYYSAPGCTTSDASRSGVTLTCTRPSTLCRLELELPGWTARVGDADAPVAACQDIFQSVAVPMGRSDVRFSFEPPHARVALFAALACLLVLLLFTIALIRDLLRGVARPSDAIA